MAYVFNVFTGKLDNAGLTAESDTLQTVTTRGATTTNSINLDGTATLDFTAIDDFVNPFSKPLITFNNYSVGATEFGAAVKSGFQKAQAAAGNATFYTLVTDAAARSIFGGGWDGEAYRRFRILSDGQLLWGGGSVTQDTNLYRSAADTLKTDDAFTAGGLITGAGLTTTGDISMTKTNPLTKLTDDVGRIYRFGTWAAGSGSAYITTNAYYDGASWQRDNASEGAVFFSIDGQSGTVRSRFRYANAGTNPITPLTAWQVNTSGVFQVPKLGAIADSTTAMQFFKADGTTAVMTIDTTNGITTAGSGGFIAQKGTIAQQKVYIGSVAADDKYPGVWFGNITPSYTNYAILCDVNGGGGILYGVPSGQSYGFRVANADVGRLSPAGLRIGGPDWALASAKLHVVGTTEQLRLGYDTSNYLSATVASTGSTTFALTGTTPTFTFSQGVTFSDGITIADAKNIILNTTTGTKIGTAVGQKLGFFNAAPVVQQTGIAALKIDYTAGDLDTEAEIITAINATNTAINALRTALNALGLTSTV